MAGTPSLRQTIFDPLHSFVVMSLTYRSQTYRGLEGSTDWEVELKSRLYRRAEVVSAFGHKSRIATMAIRIDMKRS